MYDPHPFLFGFLAFLGVMSLARLVFFRRWRRHGGYGWRGGGYGHHGYRGGPGGGRGWGRGLLYRVFERLDATPAQEKVLLAAAEEMREAARGARGEWTASREDVAKLVRGAQLDAGALNGIYARHDERLAALRVVASGAIAKVHEVLDDKQRATLARLVEGGWARMAW